MYTVYKMSWYNSISLKIVLCVGKLARAWMENSLEKLQPVNPEDLGPVLADGGGPIEGIARALGGEKWVELAKTHLLTDGE